jgi:hypothetical protein
VVQQATLCGSSTSYNQTGLGNGTYYYRVRADSSCGSSGWRNGGAISICLALNPPSSISYPASDSDGSFTVSWSSVSGATSYTLQRATNSSGLRLLITRQALAMAPTIIG